MDPQEFASHLTSLEEQINSDFLIFTQPNGKEFLLEAINEFREWYYHQDDDGTWYYKDELGTTAVRVGLECGEEHEEESIVTIPMP
jgi:hypothetical protein